MKCFVLFVLSVAIFSSAFAGVETVEIGKIQIGKTLTGTVVDPADSAMRGVQVIEVSSDWKTVLRTTTTDTNGKWFLAPTPGNKFITFASSLMASTHCRLGSS